MKSSLDWYINNNVSPVRLNIESKAKDIHMLNRISLFRHLGIIPALSRGKSIIEFGPGSGFNSLATYKTLKPGRYTLVEGNEKAINEMRNLFDINIKYASDINIVNSRITDYREPDSNYDISILENVLVGQSEAPEILINASKFAPFFIVSLVDPVGWFPELLKFYIAQLVIKECNTLDEKLKKLLPIFSPHLDSIKGMNRRYDDWIVDNLLNPAMAGELLSFPKAIELIGDNFELYNSSPKMFNDWSWYKNADYNYNNTALRQYYENLFNFIDYRIPYVSTDISIKNKIMLLDLCKEFQVLVKDSLDDIESNKNYIIKILYEIASLCSFSQGTVDSITFAINFIKGSESVERLSNHKSFSTFFGRSTHVYSFNRVPH
jgi:hypothetical protein